jgi:hypothetical protein
MTRHTIFYGDIHNHNAHGYGLGSIERSIEIAKTHLDFFSFTGHSSWHDMTPMDGGRERHWIDGFRRLKDTWPQVQRVIADANRDGEFCSFLGFEWHSSRFGDQCVIFPRDNRPLFYADRLETLRQFCIEESALMIPHHLAYPSGRRGVNWESFEADCTPIVEIYSEHGNSEDDRGPFPFFTHSMGGRDTANTVRAALARGLKFGFVGSSDDHAGFPGAYGEGLMAALAEDLSRESILEAIRARRVYALTGDRIEIDFAVDGALMGSDITTGREVEVTYSVRGRDELEMIEVIQDGVTVHRSFAKEAIAAHDGLNQPLQIRLEWGWGPWAALSLDHITDWRFDLTLSHGCIKRFFPCLQSMPFDEVRRHRFVRLSDKSLAITSYTSRKTAYRESPNQSLVLELECGPDSTLSIGLSAPVSDSTTTTISRLLAGSQNLFIGPFPREGYQWHRIVPLASSSLTDKVLLPVGRGRSNIYLRVKQKNGHVAWTSPVFMNYR